MSLKFVAICRLTVVVLAAASAAACSGESPIAPSPPSAGSDLSAKPPEAVPGLYELSFTTLDSGVYQDVSSLPVRSAEMTLKAHVTDSLGSPVQRGSVTFEYCSYKGGPPNDIERADEAPKEACLTGAARWARLGSVSVSGGSCVALGTGYACWNFGIVQIPRDVGFRMRYDPQRSGIAAATTVPENFTWTEGS